MRVALCNLALNASGIITTSPLLYENGLIFSFCCKNKARYARSARYQFFKLLFRCFNTFRADPNVRWSSKMRTVMASVNDHCDDLLIFLTDHPTVVAEGRIYFLFGDLSYFFLTLI